MTDPHADDVRRTRAPARGGPGRSTAASRDRVRPWTARSASWRRALWPSATSPTARTTPASASGCCATASAAGTAAPTGSPTPAGPSTRSAPPTATYPSSSSGTRWGHAWRCTSPTTRPWSAWSGWRRGGRPRTRSRHSPAGRWSPPTGAATASRRSRETTRYVERAQGIADRCRARRHGPARPLHAHRLDQWNDRGHRRRLVAAAGLHDRALPDSVRLGQAHPEPLQGGCHVSSPLS